MVCSAKAKFKFFPVFSPHFGFANILNDVREEGKGEGEGGGGGSTLVSISQTDLSLTLKITRSKTDSTSTQNSVLLELESIAA